MHKKVPLRVLRTPETAKAEKRITQGIYSSI